LNAAEAKKESYLVNNRTHVRNQRGFTMLEVLVTLVVILLGLLGLAGLQARVQKAQVEAYSREQALVFLGDMADRVNSNRNVGSCYALTTGSGSPSFGTGSGTLPSCTSAGSASQRATANADLAELDGLFKGASEALNATSIGSIAGAVGCIASATNADTSVTYTLAVAWQGRSGTVAVAAPTGATAATSNALACGTGSYGTDTNGVEMRRVVWTTVRIANLL
jgi:type IV pilus assembly protein PilV